MKNFSKSIIALAALAALASCAKEQAPVSPDNNGKIALTFTAGKENVETRAAIDGTDSKVINWSEGDKISVFDGAYVNCEFTLEEGAGQSTGTFSGEVTKTSADGYTALYPYQSAASFNGSSISGVVLKSKQTATAGSFDPETALMYAQSTVSGGALGFKNIVGYVKFTTGFDCSKITLISNNSANSLAGTVEITPLGTLLISAKDGTSSQVSLVPSSGNIAAGTYYIALLPGTLDKGIKLVFTMADGKTQKYKSSSNSLEIKSSGVKKLGTIEETDLKDMVYEDLSASGTANCYLITEEGDYKFKAVQGKSTTSVGTVASVDVLWESFGTDENPSVGDLIASASYSDGYIRFSTPATFKNGNAVIAAKDADGTILWSWHIWCASEGWKEQVYKNNAGKMMDRNLGATSATAGGLFYQWGRKDPFPGSSRATGTWSDNHESIRNVKTEQYPMTFYTLMTSYLPDGSWASDKTVNDPCPAGWRVPDGGSDGIWANASGYAGMFNITAGTGELDFSTVFGSDETENIKYPIAASLNGVDSWNSVGYCGFCWSVTPDSGSKAYSFAFTKNGVVLPTSTNTRYNGYSVRCLKE